MMKYYHKKICLWKALNHSQYKIREEFLPEMFINATAIIGQQLPINGAMSFKALLYHPLI